MRLNHRGEVVPCNYDFDSKAIGYVRVDLPIAYSESYHSAESRWTRHDLWKALAVTDDAVATIIVNNVFMVTVRRTVMVVETKSERIKPQISTANVGLLFQPKIPIGFVRTCPEVKDVNIPPYLLFMDESKRVSIHGGQFRTLTDAVECVDTHLYKTLISTNKHAIYMSSEGPKFL